jgi:hypothetical protein
MWQNVLVLIIVLACALAIGRRFYRQARGRSGGCGSSCSGCASPPAPTKSAEPRSTCDCCRPE